MTTTNPTLETLRAELRERLRDLPGTPAFAEALLERERLLGLAKMAASDVAAEAEAAEPSAASEVGSEASDEESSSPMPLDAWGNAILDAPGPMGQYRIRSARDGRVLHVCGEAGSQKHLLFWDYDEGELRLVCRLCFPRKPKQRSAAETSAQESHQQEHQQESDHV